MMARRTQLLVFAFKSSRTKAWLLLFSILVGVSSGFNDRLLHRSRTASAVAIATHKKRSYQQRQNPQLRNALSYPVGGPSLEQNNSWEETISQVPKSTIEHDHVTTFDKIALTASVGLSVSAVYAMLAFSSPGAWRYFLAGGVCAATSHAIPTPVDVVKVSRDL